MSGLLGAAVLELDSIAPLLGLLAALAYLIEATVEVSFTGWLKWLASLITAWTEEQQAEFRAIVQRFAAFGLGIALCLSMELDLIAAAAGILGGVEIYPPGAGIVGRVLTGILLGRGAQWFHDLGTGLFGLDIVSKGSIEVDCPYDKP